MKLIFKIIGTIITVLATSFIGENKSRGYRDRVKYLENMQLCASLLENEIKYTQTPIGEAFDKIKNNFEGVIKNILLYVCTEIKNQTDYPVYKIWNDAVDFNANCLNKNDIDVLKSFGNHLGDSDVEGQIKNINVFNSRISYYLSIAISESEKGCKLYRNLGVYSGLLLAVLFF